MATEFFKQRPEVKPTIYVYRLPGVPSHNGYLKIGYTDRLDYEERINEQLHTASIEHETLLIESAMRKDGTCFLDKEVHDVLKKHGFKQYKEGEDKNEWFKCSVDDVKEAILEVRDGIVSNEHRTQTFKMRPEQFKAVETTIEYFKKAKDDISNKSPKFLWNCKMRFGKTFAAYELAKKMGLKRILILTFKPAVESAWKEDLLNHIDFEGWQFVSDNDAKEGGSISLDKEFAACDKARPIVVFGSFQNLLGVNDRGGIKEKNEFIHTENWDLVIFDEYHFGAWRDNAKKLFLNVDEEDEVDFDAEKYQREEAGNAFNETFLPITTSYYLFLSGTPFRAINNGEFIEDQIFSWTYSDEQRAKENWKGSNNPYLSLPKMILMTYQIPDSIKEVAMEGEFNEFDLNVFFSAEGEGKDAQFKYKNEVQKWLDLIRGQYLASSVDDLKLGQDKRPPMPFSDTRLLNILSHTLWLLPNVASCEAMYNLLQEKQNNFYHEFTINLCAGPKAGIGLDALKPVIRSMEKGDKSPLETRTITLSCGKLTTGVTVRPWTGIFMLRNLKSPETYFQSAFRVQSPWTINSPDGTETILKEECYIFDFALDRALRQISDYSCRLNIDDGDPEKKVADFISFLPVLAFDGSTMKQIDAQEILDIAMAGTSATLLARRWESALLVNVDNDTLMKLLNNKEALDALMNIEGFRALNKDIETIINKSEHVKKAKSENEDEDLTPKEKKELTEEEKEYKSKRKEIQEKLIKFATRIPVFMYLTDYREKCLKDVITQLEPGLFKKVTGLSVKDFELLCSVGVFNASLMNDAIFKFKRYEDSSLSYTGIEKQNTAEVGGWDTVIRREEYEKLFFNQQSTMENESKTEEIKEDSTSIKKEDKNTTTNTHAVYVNTIKEYKDSLEIDESKIVVGCRVLHKNFGSGTISNIDKLSKYITVTFDAQGSKKFTFDAFKNGFLSFID